MKVLALVFCGALLGGTFLAADEGSAPKASPGFEKLKTLSGEWQAKTAEGLLQRVSYKVVSGGSALMETLKPGKDEPEMITVYHPDGDNLMMTHYCSANNQPRMKAEPVSGEVKTLTFSFLDATNLAGPDAGHMHRLVVTFQDKNHFTQEWTWHEKGQDAPAKVFRFERKK